jgi:cytochrome c oxidase subunit 2
MIGTVYVLESDDYEDWLAGGIVGASPVAAGADLFRQYACNTCHEASDNMRGPTLAGIAGKEVHFEGGGSATRDENYLRESILRPANQLVAGYQNLMPTYQGQISEEGVAHLIAYIKDLGKHDESSETVADAETPAGH